MPSVAKLILLTGLFVLGGAARAAPPDEAAIRAVESATEAAWNAHDAHAYAMLFAPDADIINSLGHWSRGRDAAETRLRAAFAGVFAQTVLRVGAVEIRPLAPDLALAHVGWSMSGIRDPGDPNKVQSVSGIQTQVLRREDGRWLILAYHSGVSLPELSAAAPLPIAVPQPEPSAPSAPPPPRRRCILANSSGHCLIAGKPEKP